MKYEKEQLEKSMKEGCWSFLVKRKLFGDYLNISHSIWHESLLPQQIKQAEKVLLSLLAELLDDDLPTSTPIMPLVDDAMYNRRIVKPRAILYNTPLCLESHCT